MHTTSYLKVEAFADMHLGTATGTVRVLDIGSQAHDGQRSYAGIFRRPDVEYVGLDLSHGSNVDVVPRNKFVWTELEAESFDLCVSGQTFEHNPFFWVTFAEIARVLKPGGRAMIVAPGRGPVHRYPVDCWRFYPDAWHALCVYTGLTLEETLFEDRGPGRRRDGAEWCDSSVVVRKPLLDVAAAAIFYAHLRQITATLPDDCEKASAPVDRPLASLAAYVDKSRRSSSAFRRATHALRRWFEPMSR